MEHLIFGLTKQFYSEKFKKNKSKNENKDCPMFLFEVIFGKDLALKYHDLFNLEKGKFEIYYNNEIIEEKKEENNEELAIDNEEENPEKIKVRKEFGHNIGNDFKNIFISYLDKLIK